MEDIKKNLIAARGYLAEVPENVLDLKWFKAASSSCGTLMCAAGWLTEAPQFKDKMALLETNFYGPRHILVPPDHTSPVKNSAGDYDWNWLDPIFGPNAFNMLFAERNDGEVDNEHPDVVTRNGPDGPMSAVDDSVTDKDLALWRIDQQLALIEGEA